MSNNLKHVLTIKQPWLWLILNGSKDVENRGRATSYRGRLYLHSSRTFDFNAMNRIWEMNKALCIDIVKHFGIERNRGKNTLEIKNTSSLGCILGCVDLIDCVKDCDSVWAEKNLNHWVLTNPRKLREPIRCRGNLGIWTTNMFCGKFL